MAKFIFDIDVYSDPICPWCYIGQETLDKAMASYTAEHPDAEFKLTWKPYMLWPNVGVSAYDKAAGLRAIYGPNTPAILARLDRLGAQYGINFKWEGKTGSSRDAHKLILLAMEQDAAAAAETTIPSSPDPTPTTNGIPNGTHPHPSPTSETLQKKLTTHLFTSTFQHAADPSSRPFLTHTAVLLGLFPTEADANTYLDKPEPGQVVDDSSVRARQMGVSAVPSYVVQGRYAVGGMQGEEVWGRVFERVRGVGGAGEGLNGGGDGDDGERVVVNGEGGV